MYKNAASEDIANKAKQLINDTENAYNQGYQKYLEWKNVINELKNSLNLLHKNMKEYDIKDIPGKKEGFFYSSEGSNRSHLINEYIEIVEFGKEFQSKFNKLYRIMWNSVRKDPELKKKTENNFHNVFMNWIAFSDDYTKYIKSCAEECLNFANTIKKDKNVINEMAEETINNTIPEVIPVIKDNYNYSSGIDAIKELGPNADPNQINQIINNIDSLSGRIGAKIWQMFDVIGDYVNRAIDYFGEIIGSLISKLSNAYDSFQYCFDVIKDKGIEGFFNDPQCITTMAYTIVYSTIFIFGMKILRAILRKISNVTGWLGGREEK